MILIPIFYTLCMLIYATLGEPNLLISNNGPAVLDGSITFSAMLVDFPSISKLCFFFHDSIKNHSIQADGANVTLICNFASSSYTAGTYSMTSYVTNCSSQEKISSNNTKFHLEEYLIGEIIVDQGTEGLNDVVAVGENITMAVQLYDPNGLFDRAKISYMWSIDYEPQPFVHNNISYVYKRVGESRVVSSISAQLQQNVYKFGLFDKKLTVEVPVKNVNISGKTFLYHGDILYLNISCIGSSLFRYCARPLKSDEVAANFSCNPITSTTCSFHIEHYFRNYGNYQYGIFISNDVNTIIKVVDVLVYNRSKTPQLSTIIIPIVCSLITLCIIAGGIAYYIQHHNQLAIEVADFDFQEDSFDSYVSSTFFEKIFQSCKCHICGYRNAACSGTELCDSDNDDDEDEPLIASSRQNRD